MKTLNEIQEIISAYKPLQEHFFPNSRPGTQCAELKRVEFRDIWFLQKDHEEYPKAIKNLRDLDSETHVTFIDDPHELDDRIKEGDLPRAYILSPQMSAYDYNEYNNTPFEGVSFRAKERNIPGEWMQFMASLNIEGFAYSQELMRPYFKKKPFGCTDERFVSEFKRLEDNIKTGMYRPILVTE